MVYALLGNSYCSILHSEICFKISKRHIYSKCKRTRKSKGIFQDPKTGIYCKRFLKIHEKILGYIYSFCCYFYTPAACLQKLVFREFTRKWRLGLLLEPSNS